MARWLQLGYQAARRVVVAVVGGTVVLIGVAMLVLPGPALIVIPVGLAILGVEFAWARRWLRRLRKVAVEVTSRVAGNGEDGGPPGSAAPGPSGPADHPRHRGGC
jgi:hypothetical protein